MATKKVEPDPEPETQPAPIEEETPPVSAPPANVETRLYQVSSGKKVLLTRDEAKTRGYPWKD